MSDLPILLEVTSTGVATIVLNRPEKRNALNGELLLALSQALKKIAADERNRILLLRSNGAHFCAGGDLEWMQKMTQSSHEVNERDALLLAECLYQLDTFPLPVLMLVHGKALGGGAGLLAVADIVIAEEKAIFGFPEVGIGLAPSTISPYVLRALGERYARYYCLTGALFSAARAFEMGLIHLLCDHADLMPRGEQVIQQLLQNGPNAIKKTKALFAQIRDDAISPALSKLTATHLADIRTSNEAQEGMLAFLEKRSPIWSR